jgi:putative membrane protein
MNISIMTKALIFLAIIGVLAVITYLYQKWYYEVYFYELTSDFVQIRKGPITPREINIPFERIQDVYVDQDLLDRIFGLYDVHISSATAASAGEAHIDGVEKVSADGLRTVILETVRQKITRK